MKIGYARVSTADQNLDLQLDALNAAGCARVFEDLGQSGTARSRQGLNDALAALQAGDTLVTWRLDRLGRSLPHLIELVNALNTRGCEFQSLTEAIDTTTASGKLVFHMMGALADFERSLVVERTKAGMAAAKARGKAVGRPKRLNGAQVTLARSMRSEGRSWAEIANVLRCDVSTAQRAVKR